MTYASKGHTEKAGSGAGPRSESAANHQNPRDHGLSARIMRLQRGAGNSALTLAIQQDNIAEGFLRDANAHAGALGTTIRGEAAAFDGPRGDRRLAHEVGHVLQQNSRNLPMGSLEQT